MTVRMSVSIKVEPVALSVDGFDVEWFGGRRFNFLADRGHVAVDRAGDDVLIDSPDGAEELFPGHGLAPVLHEIAEEVELEGGKVQLLLLFVDLMGGEVHADVADGIDLHRGFGRGLGASEDGLDAGGELVGVKGFDDIIARAESEPL